MKRLVDTNIWVDAKVERLGSLSKLLWLYLLTSPQGNLAGCFELTMRRVEVDTGMKAAQAQKCIEELSAAGLIRYSAESCEVLIVRWRKHNWSKSPKLEKPLRDSIKDVKDPGFREYLSGEFFDLYGKEIEKPQENRVSIPYGYSPISIPITNPVTNPVKEESTGNDSLVDTGDQYEEIVSYLNAKANRDYRSTSESTRKLIRARLDEGYTVDDFKTVVDNKVSTWLNDPKMDAYLRPSTLFQKSKFEAYLNERPRKAVRDLDKYLD